MQSDEELLQNRLNPIATTTSYERSFEDTLGMQSTSLALWSNADQTSGTISPAPSVASILSQKATHQQDLYIYCYSADEVYNPALFPGIQAWRAPSTARGWTSSSPRRRSRASMTTAREPVAPRWTCG